MQHSKQIKSVCARFTKIKLFVIKVSIPYKIINIKKIKSHWDILRPTSRLTVKVLTGLVVLYKSKHYTLIYKIVDSLVLLLLKNMIKKLRTHYFKIIWNKSCGENPRFFFFAYFGLFDHYQEYRIHTEMRIGYLCQKDKQWISSRFISSYFC